MLNKKDVLAVIICLVFATVCFGTARRSLRENSKRLLCRANLAILGKTITDYASDYEGKVPRQGGNANVTWTNHTSYWQNPPGTWQSGILNITVGASLYILVREGDLSPASFVCPSSSQRPYLGQNTNVNNPPLTELWDFGSELSIGVGSGPRDHVSYAYQMPYSMEHVSLDKPADYAIMADKNPWFDGTKLEEVMPGPTNAGLWLGMVQRLSSYWDTTYTTEQWQIQIANSYPHDRQGQNVLYVDGSVKFQTASDVGINHDNIYTIQGYGGSELAVRAGKTPYDLYCIPNSNPLYCGIQPLNSSDNILVNDDD